MAIPTIKLSILFVRAGLCSRLLLRAARIGLLLQGRLANAGEITQATMCLRHAHPAGDIIAVAMSPSLVEPASASVRREGGVGRGQVGDATGRLWMYTRADGDHSTAARRVRRDGIESLLTLVGTTVLEPASTRRGFGPTVFGRSEQPACRDHCVQMQGRTPCNDAGERRRYVEQFAESSAHRTRDAQLPVCAAQCTREISQKELSPSQKLFLDLGLGHGEVVRRGSATSSVTPLLASCFPPTARRRPTSRAGGLGDPFIDEGGAA